MGFLMERWLSKEDVEEILDWDFPNNLCENNFLDECHPALMVNERNFFLGYLSIFGPKALESLIVNRSDLPEKT